MQELFAVALFAVVLLLIALELVNRTVAALLGAAILISFGVFECLAIKSAQWGRAKPGRILILLALVTAFLSAFLDNVTTVILMVPVTFLIAHALDASPTPFLLTQVMASNIGGASTLIGDPPNILIGSAAGLTFADFVVHMSPIVLVSLPVVLGILYLMFRKGLGGGEDAETVIANMDAAGSIRDGVLLRRSLIILGLVIVAFFLHGALHLEAATIALFGAAALMLYSGVNVEEVLRDVEWPTLLFFVGLFVLVGGLEVTGFVGSIAEALTGVGEGGSVTTAIVVIWGSGLASGIVDNIPFTATMIPVIQDLAEAENLSEAQTRTLWWSLALGADFGGNLTLIGASANVVVAGMSERAGQRISFLKFMLYGIPVTLVSLAIATVYVLLRYF